MKVVCPSCGNAVPGADIDVSSGRAVCRPCGEVIQLAPSTTSAIVPAPPPLLALPDDVSERALVTPAFKPADLKLAEARDGQAWLFTLQPSRAAAVPLLAFAGVWNAFLVFWYAMALASSGGPGGIMLWFPLLHVAAGLFITYQGLVRLLNSTRVRLDEREFSVRQGPIPGKNAVESAGNVLRFETGLRSSNVGRRGGTTQQWVVKMLTKDGRQVDLPLAMGNADHAAHVAHRLNAALDENRAPVGYRG